MILAAAVALGAYLLTFERSETSERNAQSFAEGREGADSEARLADSESIIGMLRAASVSDSARISAGDELPLPVDERAFRAFAEEALLTPDQSARVLSHYRRYARHIVSLRKTDRLDLVERLDGHIQALILSELTDSQAESFRRSDFALAH